MAKITYVDLTDKKVDHISYERLSEILGVNIDDLKAEYAEKMKEFHFDLRPFTEGVECPFGERNLFDDTCYLGSGVHKCKYFDRYNFDGPHGHCIICRNPNKPIEKQKGQPVQLSLFPDF